MSSIRALTGGTRDLNPQFQGFVVTETAANTYTEQEIQIPVMRTNMPKNRAQVIELLKIYVLEPDTGQGDADAVQYSLHTVTHPSSFPDFNDPAAIIQERIETQFTTSGMSTKHQFREFDLTDGAGHGIIIATTSIFASVQGVSQGAALTLYGKLFYRFKNVSLQEFIGLAIQQSS